MIERATLGKDTSTFTPRNAALLHDHFPGDVESDATTCQTKPYHQIILFGTAELQHILPDETGMQEEGWNTCHGVMLHDKWSETNHMRKKMIARRDRTRGCVVKDTYICRDTPNRALPTETVFVRVRDEAAENRVDIECWLVERQALECKPEARNSVCRVQMNLIHYVAKVGGSLCRHQCCLLQVRQDAALSY